MKDNDITTVKDRTTGYYAKAERPWIGDERHIGTIIMWAETEEAAVARVQGVILKMQNCPHIFHVKERVREKRCMNCGFYKKDIYTSV